MTQNTDGKNTAKRIGIPNITQVEGHMGIHKGCGGNIYMKMDGPLGSWRCDKCQRVIRGEDAARMMKIQKYV